MSKYLLIPVEWMQHEVETLEMEQDGSFSHSRDSKINTLNWLLRIHKQISLSDADIEKKAEAHWEESGMYTSPVAYSALVYGYRQALLDLLK